MTIGGCRSPSVIRGSASLAGMTGVTGTLDTCRTSAIRQETPPQGTDLFEKCSHSIYLTILFFYILQIENQTYTKISLVLYTTDSLSSKQKNSYLPKL